MPGLKAAVIDSQLPADEQVLSALMNARATHMHPVQHIGEAMQSCLSSGKEEFPIIVRKYPKTLAWLAHPENAKWVQDDLPRILNYLARMSKWLNE